MKKVIEKIKPILLLLGMSLICVLIVFVVNQFKKEPEIKEVTAQEALANTQVQTESLDTSKPEEVKVSTQQAENKVLGETFSCGGNAVHIASESTCIRNGSGPVDYKTGRRTGTLVRKDAKIELVSVTVPLELFSGMEVADSNRKITTETPTYKAAGEQIDDITANSQLPPKKQVDEYKPSDEDKPFTTDYSTGVQTGEGTEISDKGKVGVDKKLTNECDGEEYNNKSNVTPTKSNGRAELMYDTYRYPNEKKLQEQEQKTMESCNEGYNTFIEWESTFSGCHISFGARFISFIKDIDDRLWDECLLNQEGCVDVKDIVLIMASPFGPDDGCDENGACTNAYMNRRNHAMQAPASTSSGKTYYTTDCVVTIDGIQRTIKCAWDMSHLYKELEASKYDDIPNVESTPTPGEYNEFLQTQVKGKRTEAIPLSQ
jgi:hypothetical protein